MGFKLELPKFGNHLAQYSAQRFIQKHGSTLFNGVGPMSDPAYIGSSAEAFKGSGTYVAQGTVIVSVPFYGYYVVDVRAENGLTRRLICKDSKAYSLFDAVRTFSYYPTGSSVLVYVNAIADFGVIICSNAANTVINDTYSSWNDLISPGSGFNFYSSKLYKTLEEGTDNELLFKYVDGQPYDGLPGDYTLTTPSGLMFHFDAELAMLRANEMCGLFIFRQTGTARLTGEELEIESLAHRDTNGLANAEIYGYRVGNIYPWEIAGFTAQDAQQNVDYLDKSKLFAGNIPLATRPTSVFLPARLQHLGGYLGQGWQTVLSAPQVDDNTSVGLARQHVGIDGTVLIESTNQIFIAKTSKIFVPNLTEQATTNDPSYSPNGIDSHNVRSDFLEDDQASVLPHEQYAMKSGWQSNVATSYRPDVDLLESVDENVFSDQNAFDLTDGDVLPPAEELTSVKIDDRYDDLKIKKILSLFTILPNGDIVIQNGQGAQIKLSQGAVYVSGTAVHVQSAKTISLFGNQLSLRGYEGAELSSAIGSIRLKADKNLSCLAGNSGQGGILLESKSLARDINIDTAEPDNNLYPGITLKSANSHVALYGGDVLLKSGAGSSGATQGNVVIESSQTIFSRASRHIRSTDVDYLDYFLEGSKDGDRPANRFTRTISSMAGSMYIRNQLIAGDSVQVGRGYFTLSGGFATADVNSTSGIGRIREPSLIENNLRIQSEQVELNRSRSKDELKLINDLSEENKPLNAEAIGTLAFGFPTSQAYGAGKQKIAQPYWHQLPISGVTNWREPDVKYNNISTLPWPGKDSWEAPGSTIATTSFKLINQSTQALTNPKSKSTYLNVSSDDYGFSQNSKFSEGVKVIPTTR
jgi:hypothetical protein